MFSVPALAEVCDKLVPMWNPSHGPVGQIEHTLNTFINPFIGVPVAILLLTCLGFRNRFVKSICLAMLLIFTWVIASGYDDQVYEAAMAEGCVTRPVLSTVVMAGICIWLTYRLVKGPRNLMS